VSSPEKRADRPSQIRGQLDYHARRLALYQRLHGSRPSSRLTELEKAYHTAQQRMAGAGERDLPGPGASARAEGARAPVRGRGPHGGALGKGLGPTAR
jgi:hypothetical protein